MGQALQTSIERHDDLDLVGIWRRGDDIDTLVEAADVVIDFSLPDGTAAVVAAAVAHGKALVCGVSGLDETQSGELLEASRQIPLVFDRNMSLGIAVLERSVREAAASLGAEFSVEIAEIHHVNKKDSPSGTALKLGEAIAGARGETGTDGFHFDVQRRGEVPGDHKVILRSTTEELTFSHSVMTRQVFVDGAIRAAKWVFDRAPGHYCMQDVLFSDLN